MLRGKFILRPKYRSILHPIKCQLHFSLPNAPSASHKPAIFLVPKTKSGILQKQVHKSMPSGGAPVNRLQGITMYNYLFGPVPSRRLGISLGVDLVPHKTCTLDCIYCECGETTNLTMERQEYIPVDEVLKELERGYPPPERQGFTVFLTGLSGAGKSTIAKILYARFLEIGDRPVSLLDGDIVRHNLSSELSFSREHRDINVRRIGFVASEITKNRGIAICAPIAPYTKTRDEIRKTIEAYGGFIEVHVATPIETCETRDRKGMYAKARAGLIKGFTGVDDPYETPESAEVSIDTTNLTHIMRAVMGLYLGMVVFWLYGAFRRSMVGPALAAWAVFMLGLAAGRILSFILDGLPHWLLVVYAALEIVLGLIAVALYRGHSSKEQPAAQ